MKRMGADEIPANVLSAYIRVIRGSTSSEKRQIMNEPAVVAEHPLGRLNPWSGRLRKRGTGVIRPSFIFFNKARLLNR